MFGMFDDRFKRKVVKSFRKSRNETESLKQGVGYLTREQDLLKQNTNEWIKFLMHENQMLKQRVAVLESKVDEPAMIKNFRY